MNNGFSKENRKLVAVLLIGILIGASGAWIWSTTLSMNKRIADKKEILTSSVEESRKSVTINENNIELTKNVSIIVPNQPAGNKVILNKVILEDDGWVVIHEGDASRIGNALGATRFDAGEYSGVVELLRPTESGKIYRAVLYRDNGDRIFDLDYDFPVLHRGNQPVLTMFFAQ